MKKELKKYWKAGYHFVEGSYYGDSDIDEWEDVTDLLEEVKSEPYLELNVKVEEEKHLIYLFVQNYE